MTKDIKGYDLVKALKQDAERREQAKKRKALTKDVLLILASLVGAAALLYFGGK